MRLLSSAVIGLLAASLVACSGGGSSATSGGAQVETTLADFSVSLAPTEVAAGGVELAVSNEGQTVHEVEIFKLPEGVDAASLPVNNNVADTDAAGLELVDEVEDVTPSASRDLAVTLQPGRYAVICNLPTHYELGMHATLVVN